MNSERWRKIEEIYHSALECAPELRAVFLAESCRDDDELRREVESLLAQPGRDGILARPAWKDAETALNSTATQIVPGTKLGAFQIEASIGVGGMGEVFKARDTRLGRRVAIKVSHERFSDRFEREARAISALNHPHICTLYDVGPNYLVMELVEGETLAARLKKGNLSLEKTLRYATQTAEALAEAHAHAIVHRDLKPSNIMLTRHGVKVLDFGLAKMLSEPAVTETRAVMGTPAYMAPEQAEGREPSSATDLFSFGLVLYEMAAGKLPFPGASLAQMLSTGSNATIRPPSEQRSELPAELDELVVKLLRKDPALRPQSASEVARQLAALADRLAAPPLQSRGRPTLAVGAIVMIFLLAGGGWLYRRIEQRRWVREEAIPQMNKLAPQEPLAAFLLLRKAEQILPGDAQLAAIAKSATQLTSIESAPAGAKVEIQDYLSPGDWFSLGTTPLKSVRLPVGYFRWKISKPGYKEFVAAPPTSDAMKFALPSADQDAGMVPVPGGIWGALVDFLGWLVYPLPAYDIDRFEVTNAEYQKFVDQGGYRKPEYWKEKFTKDGKELTWGQAMDLFRDPTGRPGPSAWEAGHFPQGQAEYPVSGVSWYEAAAYAAFVGKSLPAIGQWIKAAPADLAPFSANQSNFGGRGPVQVGTLAGVGPYGTYDMAGNVREWCLTATDDGRFILGGAWRTQTYAAMDPEVLPPFDRSLLNGFRTVRNHSVLSAAAAAPLVRRGRDFSTARPVSDEVFQAYKTMYAYDRTPLNAKTEGIVEDSEAWTKEKITIDAGYEGQRLPMYLFLPKNVHPPFQTVLFFPSARVEFMTHSQNLGDMQFVDYAIKSGRALLYPIYQGTYERVALKQARPGDIEDLQLVIQRSKEVRRSVDYLATRPEIDASKLAYLGVSMGGAYGVIFTALEDRFRTVVFLDGGFFLGPAQRGRDQVDFAHRITKPVLMVNGKYDSSFSPQRAQEPLWRMLGTPEGDKLRVVLDTPHDVSQEKEALSKEVLAWLDKYLGRVN